MNHDRYRFNPRAILENDVRRIDILEFSEVASDETAITNFVEIV
jgi:hypothetical protein